MGSGRCLLIFERLATCPGTLWQGSGNLLLGLFVKLAGRFDVGLRRRVLVAAFQRSPNGVRPKIVNFWRSVALLD